MRHRWILIIVFAVLLMGAMSIEDKIIIPLYNWFGLDSDESFSVDFTKPIDSWNIEIGNEGGRTFIQQRKGSQLILSNPPGDEIYAIKIIQVAGDSELVLIAEDNGNVHYTTGVGDGAGGAGSGVWKDVIPGAPAVVYTTFTLFKDTVIYVAGNDVYLFAFNSSNFAFADSFLDGRFDYQGHFLHQDRIYGWGTADSNNCKIFWMPEFDIDFGKAHMDTNAAHDYSGFVYVDKDGGDFLTNVLPLGEHIMAYKSRTIYKILVSPTTNYPVEVVKFVENTGAYGFNAAIAWNNVHFFVAEDGVYENNGASIRKLSDPIDYWFRDSLVHSNGKAKVFNLCVYDNKLFVTLPKKVLATPSSVADYRTFVYDLDSRVWAKWKMVPTDPDDGTAESHHMLRYEYSPTCSAPLTGSKFLKQRIMFVRDTAGGSDDDRIWLYPRESGLSDDGGTFESSYTLPLSPITSMTKRKQVERVIIYGEATVAGADSAVNNYIIWRNENGKIDSTYFNAQASTFLHNKRVSPKVVGDLIGFQFAIRDTNRIKINGLEVVASEKGLSSEN